MKALFSEEGAKFSLARTHIGACDFTVEEDIHMQTEKVIPNLNHSVLTRISQDSVSQNTRE
jgi:O-glycosyl hydrolase